MPKPVDHVPFCAIGVVVLAAFAGWPWLVAGCSGGEGQNSVAAGSGAGAGGYEDAMAGVGGASADGRNEAGGAGSNWDSGLSDAQTGGTGSGQEAGTDGGRAGGWVCGPASDWRELPTDGVVPPVRLPGGGSPFAVAADGRLVVRYYYGDRPAAVRERGVWIYEPEQDQWRSVPEAEQVPAEIESNPQPRGYGSGKELVRGSDANGNASWAAFDLLSGTWELFDATNALGYLYLPLEPFMLSSGSTPAVLWISDGTGDYVLASSTYQSTESFVREYNHAVVDTRVFAWGGRTKVCRDAPDCTPVGFRNVNSAQPYFDQEVHGDGEVFDAATGTRVPIRLQDAPSPRYSALVQPMGTKVLVFGGLYNPYWGWGAGPESTYLAADGALYDLDRERWMPFTPPDGLPPPSVSGLETEEGTARFSFQWTGKYALATVRISTGAASEERRHYLYDPEADSWRSLDVDAVASFLVTRAGNLLLLDPDYGGATLLDAEDLSTRRIELNPPAMLQDDELVGPTVTAWDGCSFFVWGFGRVEYSTVTDYCTDVPPDTGCDPPSPEVRVTQRLGGARFAIE